MKKYPTPRKQIEERFKNYYDWIVSPWVSEILNSMAVERIRSNVEKAATEYFEKIKENRNHEDKIL